MTISFPENIGAGYHSKPFIGEMWKFLFSCYPTRVTMHIATVDIACSIKPICRERRIKPICKCNTMRAIDLFYKNMAHLEFQAGED